MDTNKVRRPMFIGPIGCGKTTLLQRINHLEMHYNKTQSIEFYNNIIDTPGEYIEHRRMYTNLATTAMDAGAIVLMQSAVDSRIVFPEAFGTMFARPLVGVVTKIDLAEDDAQINLVKQRLKSAGTKQVFTLSAMTNQNVNEFVEFLRKTREQEMEANKPD